MLHDNAMQHQALRYEHYGEPSCPGAHRPRSQGTSGNGASSNGPLAPLVPNDETIAAMKEARAGNLPQFADVGSLFDDLHADD